MTRWDRIVQAIRAIKAKLEYVDREHARIHETLADMAAKQDQALDALRALSKDVEHLRLGIAEAIERSGAEQQRVIRLVQTFEGRLAKLEPGRYSVKA